LVFAHIYNEECRSIKTNLMKNIQHKKWRGEENLSCHGGIQSEWVNGLSFISNLW